jgi:hypothetical protein
MPARSSGTLLTLSRNADYAAAACQLFITSPGAVYVRAKTVNRWNAWNELASVQEPAVYYVGPTREHTSLVALLMELAGDATEKTIYIDPGEYDIYQEYRDNDMPEPPDPTSTSMLDYELYNAIVPANTRIIGIGSVTLKFMPGPNYITFHTSRLWSCLNLMYGGNTVENLTLHVKNCRYAIHDESSNAYQRYTNVYRRLRIIAEENDDAPGVIIDDKQQKLGSQSVIGIGFEDDTSYIFEDCHITGKTNNGMCSAFYGHDGSAAGGARVVVRGCVIENVNANGQTVAYGACVRLQSLRTWGNTSRANLAYFEGCHITGGIRLQSPGTGQGGLWDATIVRSGDPPQTIDEAARAGVIKVYE